MQSYTLFLATKVKAAKADPQNVSSLAFVFLVLDFLCTSWATVSIHLFVPGCPAVMLHCNCSGYCITK